MPRRPDRRPFGPGPHVHSASVQPDHEPAAGEYPFVPAVHDLARLAPAPTLERIEADDADAVRLTTELMQAPDRDLRPVLDDDA
jgi:hypothetical protein